MHKYIRSTSLEIVASVVVLYKAILQHPGCDSISTKSLLSGFSFGGCAFPFWEIIAPSDQPYQGLSKFTILSLRVLSLLSCKSKKFTLRFLFWWLCIELRIFSKFEAIAIFG
jgi:hypothetical protein